LRMPRVNVNAAAAIVTGHSRGLGEAIAADLLARGLTVLGIARHENARLGAEFPSLRQAALDLADSTALTRWLSTDALTQFVSGVGTALLVNNAGVLQPIGPPETQDVEAVARAVSVNVGAALMFSAAFARATTPRCEGRILHISSGAGRKPYAGWSIYCATKAALDHHARCVALDGPPGLSISSIAPGVIDTDMQAEIRASSDDRFPERPRFVAMHRDNALPSAAQRAEAIVEYLLSEGYGSEPVFDLRDFQRAPSATLTSNGG